jgi:hypothetical protein
MNLKKRGDIIRIGSKNINKPCNFYTENRSLGHENTAKTFPV